VPGFGNNTQSGLWNIGWLSWQLCERSSKLSFWVRVRGVAQTVESQTPGNSPKPNWTPLENPHTPTVCVCKWQRWSDAVRVRGSETPVESPSERASQDDSNFAGLHFSGWLQKISLFSMPRLSLQFSFQSATREATSKPTTTEKPEKNVAWECVSKANWLPTPPGPTGGMINIGECQLIMCAAISNNVTVCQYPKMNKLWFPTVYVRHLIKNTIFLKMFISDN